MCGFQFSYFGAGYEDALCIDGFLWDLDSGDFTEGLTSGGEMPCPRCSTGDFLAANLEEQRGGYSTGRSPAEHWEAIILFCLDLAPDQTAAHLRHQAPVILYDHKGRLYDEAPVLEDDPNMVEVTWPWHMERLTNHQRVAIQPRGPKK